MAPGRHKRSVQLLDCAFQFGFSCLENASTATSQKRLKKAIQQIKRTSTLHTPYLPLADLPSMLVQQRVQAVFSFPFSFHCIIGRLR
jgi:hypothetical protein